MNIATDLLDPRLPELGFRLLLPRPALRPFVRSYWTFSASLPAAGRREETMHPMGGFGLVFNLGDALELDATPPDEPVFLDGATTVSRRMGFQGRVEVIGVAFRAGGAYPFLGPLGELRNEVSPDTVQEPGLSSLHGRLMEANSPAARVALLDGWLLERLSLGREHSPLVPASLAAIRAVAGSMSIAELSRQLAVGQRQLERLFQAQVGMTPKQFARLLRVDRARTAIKGPHAGSLAGLGADLGYFDQSHFIHDFRAVTGMTPDAYRRRSRPGV